MYISCVWRYATSCKYVSPHTYIYHLQLDYPHETQSSNNKLLVLVLVAYPKLHTMSKRARSRSISSPPTPRTPSTMSTRARSRSISSPPTPRTPSDAFQVSGDEDELVMSFDCKVIMNSGAPLGCFECDQHTSMGYVRSRVRQIVTDMRNKGLLPEFDSFRLLRGEQICSYDYNKIFEMFKSGDDCVLTVVMLQA